MLTVPSPAGYKTDLAYLKEPDSLAFANVQVNLEQALKNHFRNPGHFGFPEFKAKHFAKKSYTTNNQHGGTVALNVQDSCIRLPKVGMVKAVFHRLPPEGWDVRSATVSQEKDGSYYVSILFEFDKPSITASAVADDSAIAFDYKSDGLYKDSNGKTCGMPHYFREAQRRLKKMKQGSHNYERRKKRVAKIYRHIANQRRDFLQKESSAIAKQYDTVCAESLNMKAMSNKKFGNGKATLDNGYGMFLDMLEYKLADKGGRLVRVDKWYPSSQLCSRCGERHPEMKNLKIRKLHCSCGLVIDRDYNAALNIKAEGLRILSA